MVLVLRLLFFFSLPVLANDAFSTYRCKGTAGQLNGMHNLDILVTTQVISSEKLQVVMLDSVLKTNDEIYTAAIGWPLVNRSVAAAWTGEELTSLNYHHRHPATTPLVIVGPEGSMLRTEVWPSQSRVFTLTSKNTSESSFTSTEWDLRPPIVSPYSYFSGHRTAVLSTDKSCLCISGFLEERFSLTDLKDGSASFKVADSKAPDKSRFEWSLACTLKQEAAACGIICRKN